MNITTTYACKYTLIKDELRELNVSAELSTQSRDAGDWINVDVSDLYLEDVHSNETLDIDAIDERDYQGIIDMLTQKGEENGCQLVQERLEALADARYEAYKDR